MSNTSKGYLFYGYVEPVTKDANKEGDDGTWQEAVDNVWGDDYEKYTALSRQLGVELDYSGYGDYPANYIRLKQYEVQWSQTMLIDPTELATVGTPEDLQKLQTFAEAIGIDLTGLTPGWYLASYYG